MTFSVTNMTVSLIVVAILGIAFSGFYFGLASNYNVDIPEEYENLYNEFQQTQELIIETENVVGEGTINEDAQDIAIFKAAITAGKLIRNSAKILITSLTDAAKIMSIPQAIIGAIIAIIILMVSMAFLSFVTRGRTP